jgi:hypothetical protein
MTTIARELFSMRVALTRGASARGRTSPGDTGLKRTLAPGAKSAGGVRFESKTFTALRPMICQPPGDSHG